MTDKIKEQNDLMLFNISITSDDLRRKIEQYLQFVEKNFGVSVRINIMLRMHGIYKNKEEIDLLINEINETIKVFDGISKTDK